MKIYELKLSTGKTVLWEGESGLDACQRYANSHPSDVVIAWRTHIRHGIFVATTKIIEF